MSKVVFNADDSVLRQWEQMHRPPDTIPTSGPMRNTRAGLIVPLPPKGSGGTRRHSVISSSRDVTAFPIRTNEGVNDARRPSDLWLSKCA